MKNDLQKQSVENGSHSVSALLLLFVGHLLTEQFFYGKRLRITVDFN